MLELISKMFFDVALKKYDVKMYKKNIAGLIHNSL